MFVRYVHALCTCVMFMRYVHALCTCVMFMRYVYVLCSCVMFMRYKHALCSCVMYMGYVHLGPDYIIFSADLNFSQVRPVEISARLLKQILLKSNWRLHGEGCSPGKPFGKSLKKYHEYRNFSPGWKASLYTRSDFVFIHVFDAKGDISACAEICHVIATKFRPRAEIRLVIRSLVPSFLG